MISCGVISCGVLLNNGVVVSKIVSVAIFAGSVMTLTGSIIVLVLR